MLRQFLSATGVVTVWPRPKGGSGSSDIATGDGGRLEPGRRNGEGSLLKKMHATGRNLKQFSHAPATGTSRQATFQVNTGSDGDLDRRKGRPCFHKGTEHAVHAAKRPCFAAVFISGSIIL